MEETGNGTASEPSLSGAEYGYLKKILTDEEYALVPETIAEKIENCIQQSFDEFLTKKALYETLKTQYEQDKEKIEFELQEKTKQLDALNIKLELTNSTVSELEEKLKGAHDELAKIQAVNKQLQYEWKDFKVQRDLAVDEKESLIQMLERRNSELDRIKSELNELSKKYQLAVKAKIVALQNSEEVESLKISLEYKEKRLEQESALLRSQIEALTEELQRQTTELMNLKREASVKAVSIEAEISEKTQELNIAKQNNVDLNEENEKLKEKIKTLSDKLNEQGKNIDDMYYNFQQELQAQIKLSELYKGLCDENDSKTEKLTSTISELQQLLREASEQYGDLETMNKQIMLEHQEEIEKKNDCIQLLRKELKDANDLLKAAKEENLEAAMATLSPCAASASRLIKSGMTLTQIYSQYATVSEELLLEKEENRKLKLYVTTILNEIEEKAPILKQQRLDYEKALNNVESMTKQMDEMITESKILEQECVEAKKTSEHFRRENERLGKEICDLSRQVCYLIKTVEEARGGIVKDGFDNTNASYDGSESSAQLVISKKLVTFGSIQDLQENNQKLLALVRKLSMKQEAAENISSEEFYDLKVKEEKLQARVNDLLEDMERQSKMMELIKNQSLTYKKLYEQALGGLPSDNLTPEKLTPVKGSLTLMTSTPKSAAPDDCKQLEELKKSMRDLEDKNKKLLEDKDKYKTELANVERKLTDEITKLKKEVTDLIYKNSKLIAQAEFHEEKCKILEGNLTTCKKQIKALEERNQMLSEISAKHEQSMLHLKDETMEAQTKLSKAEVALESIRQENFLLKNAEFRLLKERESWNREMHSHSLLMTNLDAIKAAFERSEEEGKLRLENQLSEALKECTALRNSLKDEKDRFKELATSLERQTALAKERQMEEKKMADRARKDLDDLKGELQRKNQEIENLHNKIKELNNQPTKSIIESVTVNLDESVKKMKEYEKKIKDLEGEINSLQMQLSVTKQHNAQYCEMAENLEKQMADANEEHSVFRTLMTERIDDAIKSEMALKAKYEELEQKYQAVTKVQKTSTDELNAKLESSSTELKSTSTELSNLRHELEMREEELKKANETICELENSLQEAESKYSNEVVLHSSDIQSLASAKSDLSETKKELTRLTFERDEALNTLREKESFWDEQEKKSKEEIQRLNERLAALDEQNTALHESLLKLGNQVAVLQSRVVDEGQKPVEETLQESAELPSKTQDQLLKVIKFLRQEKDLAVTRSEILQSENMRLKGQLAMTVKKLEEANESLKNTQESKESSMKASAKHAELLRKIDTFNALTDSNRLLREEREKLKAEVAAMKVKLEEAEAKLPSLLKEQKRLSEKVETLSTENQGLLMDVAKWRQRANTLAERSNKGTPEDWRRLTNERENLAKQWQLEKNNNEKLEEELKKVKQEKNALSEQITHVQKNLQNDVIEIRRLTEESNSFKQQNAKSNEELIATKAQLTKVTEESAKLLNEVNANKVIINDLRAKEAQLKKIGKKYKMQFEELLKTTEEEKKAREDEEKKKSEEEATKPTAILDEERERLKEEGRQEVKSELNSKLTEMEARLTEKIRELEAKAVAAQEESENLKRDNENLKTSINEKEERAKQVMKTARSKIVQLTEQKNNLEQELKQLKGQTELSRDESDTRISNLKAQYESIISEMEKERSDQAVERDQERDRLSSQIKSLNQRVNQLQRSLEKQLGSKPSTSSRPADKSTMEPPTANIKPMAGSSSTVRQKLKQTTGPVSPCWRSSGNETPFASIRPTISMTPTVAVLPTSQTNNNQTSSSQSTTIMVLPQQQIVHTTGNSGEALSSSPTSSHTDYMPATSSATPIRQVVVAPTLSVGTHMGSDAQSTQEMEAEANDNEIQQQTSNQQSQTMAQQPQNLTVAMIIPRVEHQATTTQNNQRQSVDQSCGVAYSQANSSNTVTTTQAGLKRPRDVEGDSSTSMEGDEISKTGPQSKRTRVSVIGNQAEAFHHQVTHSEGIEVEYQVPTSSQRDQEDDMIIMVDSEEEGNADEGEVEEPDDEPEFEEEDNGEGYEIGSYSRDGQDMGLTTYDEGPDIDEENVPDQDNNEVEVIDDSNEVPNQSGSSRDGGADNGNATQSSSNAAVPVASSIESGGQDQTLQQSSEATSSGPVNSDGGNNIIVVSQAASSQSSQTFRARNVPPLGRQQQSQLVLPQTYEESGDDGIVPSTPTLFIPRRNDGFGEAVSSPQVPHQASFIFSDPSPPISRSGIPQASVEGSEDGSQLEEPGTGRSVPTTPLQASPQELPMGELINEVGQSSSASHGEGEQGEASLNIPDITVTVVEDDGNSEMPPSELTHFAGEEEEEESNEKGDTSGEEPEIINLDEDNDGVTSEGEKPLSAVGEIEEGREAEASEPFDSNNIRRPTGRIGGTARRSGRMGFPRRSQSRRPTPIVWSEPGSSSSSTGVGSAFPVLRTTIQPVRIMMSDPQRMVMRGRSSRGRKWR